MALTLAATACATRARTTAEPAERPAPYPVNFDPSIFDASSATIDNPWWPLTPGKQLVWEGEAFEDGERVERRVVFTVTDLVKRVAGVTVLVGWDRDYNDGVLAEAEIIFLAQDRQGNVWHLGQYRETYDEDGELAGGRAWLAGYLEGAKAGMLMTADPKPGSTYSQGFAPPPWNWDDVARVYRVGERTCVPTGCYDDVLVIEEFEPTKPGASQLKYYARGVGNVRVGWLGEEEQERETMVLLSAVELGADGMAEARREAFALEQRAYLYGLTDPARVRAE